MKKRPIQIAIDGPAAAGKSTIARKTAEQMGITYVDTGAMYRAITLKALEHGIDPASDSAMIALLEASSIELQPSSEGQLVLLDGRDVTEAIRRSAVTARVSHAAAQPSVRKWMVAHQRALAGSASVIMDGRDIGTDVLPEAQLKVFMIASVEERAQRRLQDNAARGIECTLEQLKREIEARDKIDSERAASPLRRAEDAVLLDTTGLSVEEVVARVLALAEKRGLVE